MAATGTHRCDPPCELMRMEEHSKARRRMTKAQLLADADLGDAAYLDMAESHGMAEAYYGQLEKHLRAHGCQHNFGDVADEPEVVS